MRILSVDTSLLRNDALISAASVRALYQSRNYSLQWYDTGSLKRTGDSLLYFITNADQFGLIPEDYHLQRLDSLVKRNNSDDEIVEIDMLLSDSFFAIRSHLKNGRVDPKTFTMISYSDSIDQDGVSLLKSNLQNILVHKAFISQEPPHYQYHILKDSLQQFLAIDAPDSLMVLKIEKIQVTMERWRHVKEFPDRYIHVNIPAYRLYVMEASDTVLTSNVIVGKPISKTPELESIITSFIIYPYWHVPRGIATKEILPSIKRDSMYLVNHNYEVLDAWGEVQDAATIDWQSLSEDNFPYQLRQQEGRENSMGIVKFMFKNPYGVYLHDTNSRRLFSKDVRAFSHGCVRVEQRRDLARYLVRDDNVYVTADDVDQYISLQQRIEIRVRKPLPLFIQYFTCEFNNGILHYYNDIYQKDFLILQALQKLNGQQHLAANFQP